MIGDEIEGFLRLRQLKDEPREVYLLRVARAADGRLPEAADRLTPRAYAWLSDARGRALAGRYPLEFDDESIEVSVGEQLFALLEAEDDVDAKIREKRARHGKKPREGRSSDYQRVAQYLLTFPEASDLGVARELSSTGWSVSEKRVREIRNNLRHCITAMKSCGILMRRADGTRIIGL